MHTLAFNEIFVFSAEDGGKMGKGFIGKRALHKHTHESKCRGFAATDYRRVRKLEGLLHVCQRNRGKRERGTLGMEITEDVGGVK